MQARQAPYTINETLPNPRRAIHLAAAAWGGGVAGRRNCCAARVRLQPLIPSLPQGGLCPTRAWLHGVCALPIRPPPSAARPVAGRGSRTHCAPRRDAAHRPQGSSHFSLHSGCAPGARPDRLLRSPLAARSMPGAVAPQCTMVHLRGAMCPVLGIRERGWRKRQLLQSAAQAQGCPLRR